jgi:stage III sporulation protein AB
MTIKIIGAILILIACASFGLIIAYHHRKEVSTLKKLITALDYMECELQYRMCALPDLCRQTAAEFDGVLRSVFLQLSNELEDQISPDVRRCMQSVLAKMKDIPSVTLECLQTLGDSLGRYDLQGQLSALEAVSQLCKRDLEGLQLNRDARLRSYTTLGFCGGVALVILFI